MITVAGYTVDDGLAYDPEHNLWVQRRGGDSVRVGYDPLGAETAGDIVAIALPQLGSVVGRGAPLATIEAAKFVGPLPAPVAGTVSAVNESLLLNPAAVNTDPLGSWIAQLDGVAQADLSRLIAGAEAIRHWFAEAVERFRAQGVIAE